ncbi:MAG TPA: AtpZ/AtpI family protein, partial [Candidatus Moranbacteria bacterium]|nr:AtpZ/AtpI family protein [Candidatus Moranbacteria bacterium]
LSGWIALPILSAVMVGKWLDRKFQSAPWLLLISVGIAFVVSMVALVVIGRREMGKIEKRK